MNVYATEEEQIQQLKRWFKSYGPTIILSGVLALAIGFGWRYWQQEKIKTSQAASLQYELMLNADASHQAASTKEKADLLIKDYKSTPYAAFASLLLAKIAVDNQQYDDALENLQWVIDNSSIDSLKQTARLRISRILIAQDKASQALQMLSAITAPSYVGVVSDLKGDAYLSMGQDSDARIAYESALKNLPSTDALRPLLQIKLDNLAQHGPQGSSLKVNESKA